MGAKHHGWQSKSLSASCDSISRRAIAGVSCSACGAGRVRVAVVAAMVAAVVAAMVAAMVAAVVATVVATV
eukprot:3850429-Alexandrium_andersonii.AAC.1